MSTLHYPIRVPSDLLEALGEFSGNFWSDSLALEPLICDAIRNYLKPAPANAAQPGKGSEAGYQWKQVFLPDGTRLRASFGGKSYCAQVTGEEILWDGRALSPSQFANLQGSGNRNAWKAVWLRLPGSEAWLLADVCRSAQRAAITRLHGDAAAARRERRRAAPRDNLPEGHHLPDLAAAAAETAAAAATGPAAATAAAAPYAAARAMPGAMPSPSCASLLQQMLAAAAGGMARPHPAVTAVIRVKRRRGR